MYSEGVSGPKMEILRATQASAVNRMDSTDSGTTPPLGWRSSISGLLGIGKSSWVDVAGTGKALSAADKSIAVEFWTCKVEGGLDC